MERHRVHCTVCVILDISCRDEKHWPKQTLGIELTSGLLKVSLEDGRAEHDENAEQRPERPSRGLSRLLRILISEASYLKKKVYRVAERGHDVTKWFALPTNEEREDHTTETRSPRPDTSRRS